MKTPDLPTQFIDVSRLRVGHYIVLDLGWMAHPFPVNSFKIKSEEQIEAIRSLGIDRIRFAPERSDPDPGPLAPEHAATPPAVTATSADTRDQLKRRELRRRQRCDLQTCERQFDDASRAYRQVNELVRTQPNAARDAAQGLIETIVGQMLGEQESCIRLLSEKVGERTSLHAINVTIISLLLGRALRFDQATLRALGLGALLHDIGKAELPDRLRYQREQLGPIEQQLYQEHVAHGVALGKRMALPPEVLAVIAQHHEHVDGSGYPNRLTGERMSAAGRVVSLVDRYDKLCNPGNPVQALTPHEALSQIYAQARQRFDGPTLATFIRMMGVYPPGSVVQLADERYALVVSVNSTRPLKPCVIIHDPEVPREEAIIVDLESNPALGIRRSLRPLQLPKATIDYLSPQQRVCYFFEHARGAGDDGSGE